MSPVPENIIACPHCDLLEVIPPLPPRGKARCPRCGKIVAVSKPDSLNRTLALTVAAAIAYIVANIWPMMGLMAVGRTSRTTVIGAVEQMWRQGEPITAVLVGFCVVLAPAVQIGFMLVLLLAVRRSPAPEWAGELLRWFEFHQPWAMVEVMMLGVLVSLVKIADLATVIPDVGMFSLGALIFLFAGITAAFDPEKVWERVRWANGEGPKEAGG